jgi:DNA-binding IscR family transcriptional regulator
MQLIRLADYSLRVLIFLERWHGARTTIRDIAEAHEVSENHLI